MKDTRLKMGVKGLGTGPRNRLRCMDIRWDYWDKGWRFPENFGAWDCTLVMMFVLFFPSVIHRGAGVEHPKKSLPLSFWQTISSNLQLEFHPPILMDCNTKLRLCDLMGWRIKIANTFVIMEELLWSSVTY